MWSRFAISMAGMFAVTGCTTASREADSSLDQLGRDLARTVCPGPPSAVQIVKNPHVAGQVDTLENRECAAGSSTLYVTPGGLEAKTLAVAVEVRGRVSGLPDHLQIGEPFAQAMHVLGDPESRSFESAVYGLAFDSGDTLTVRIASGRIASLHWAWALD